MNTLRRLVPGLVLGLTMAIGGVGLAQQAAQSAGDKKESVCCASCACCGDSCALTKKEAKKNHAATCEKHEGCCGASCDMKDSVKKNQVATARHECCADSGSKKSGTVTNKATSSIHECCSGDSRAIKDHAKVTASTMKHGFHACCCADSCKMENLKTKGGQ